MKHFLYTLIFSVFFVTTSVAQSTTDIKKIISHYDLKLLKEKEKNFRIKQRVEKTAAIKAAKINNWPLIKIGRDGSKSELMKLTPDGKKPIYYTTENVGAARSTRTNHLHAGGSLGLNIEGQEMTVRVWDGGNVRASHNAFGGRVSVIDNPASEVYNTHATHVTGTMIASALPASVKGMAPQANARTFDWNADLSEVAEEAQLGMLVSNHSYSVDYIPDYSYMYGTYQEIPHHWDELAYLAPYYLSVWAAGNSGELININPLPLFAGYDKLSFTKVAKNNLVVASCEDVSVNNSGIVTGSINISSFSSQGPTDDLRIKPDITGNGLSVNSLNSVNNTSTTYMSGTSMASANVSGSLILLQQYHRELYGSFMRSATLKGLACHTADDAGNVGPDAKFGWGLLNTKKAAEVIKNNGLSSWIEEKKLNQGQVYTISVNSDGTQPLMASITWTDVAGAINSSFIANDPTPALINDLDIRITKDGATYYPWRLLSNPSLPAVRDGDNHVDNVELIKIDAPAAGQYTITISHKGTLVSGSQDYSLVVTGVVSAFSINPNPLLSDVVACQSDVPTMAFTYTQIGEGTTNFSISGLPTGAIATLYAPSLSSSGVIALGISGLENVAPGAYTISITGTNGTETETENGTLTVFSSQYNNVILNSPTDGQSPMPIGVILKWQAQANATSYRVQVSTSPTFAPSFIVTDQTVTPTELSLTGLQEATSYFWRVVSVNQCGQGKLSVATKRHFKTGILDCKIVRTVKANNYVNSIINPSTSSNASASLTMTGGFIIGGNMIAKVMIEHTFIADLTVSLEGPASIGSPVIDLLIQPCGDNDNINCTFTANGVPPACSGTSGLTGFVIPEESFDLFYGLPADGEWKLKVRDPYYGDGGKITYFALSFCALNDANPEGRLKNIVGKSNSKMEVSGKNANMIDVEVSPNPSKGIINIQISDKLEPLSVIILKDLSGREIMRKETNQLSEFLNVEMLPNGLYIVTINNGGRVFSKKIILAK